MNHYNYLIVYIVINYIITKCIIIKIKKHLFNLIINNKKNKLDAQNIPSEKLEINKNVGVLKLFFFSEKYIPKKALIYILSPMLLHIPHKESAIEHRNKRSEISKA